MEAGRELDALIAEKVMGWKIKYNDYGAAPRWVDSKGDFTCWDNSFNTEPAEFFKPSTSIEHAWQVVKKIQALSNGHDWFTLNNANGRWQATFKTGAYYEPIDHVNADTAPHAICLAALKAMEGKC